MIKRFISILVLTVLLTFPTAVFALTQTEADAQGGRILDPGVINQGGGGRKVPVNFMGEVVPKIIKLTLAAGGTITFVVLVYAGVMLIIAQGNEEDMKKFKDTLIWAIVGLIFITTAYGIVRGVLLINFK